MLLWKWLSLSCSYIKTSLKIVWIYYWLITKINHAIFTIFISKILTDLCSIRQNVKIKNTYANIVYRGLGYERLLIEYRKICVEINGKQSVKLESGSIKFENYFKQEAIASKNLCWIWTSF